MQVEIRRVERLAEEDIAAMERLYRDTYVGAPDEAFRRDLAEKSRAIILREGDMVRGFSTMKLLHVDGMRILFSGDTVVAQNCRGQFGLAGAFGHVMKRLADEGGDPVFWFLICKGVRTYRFLPIFFHRYTPGPAKDAELEKRLECVASTMFPAVYDKSRGILHFGAGKDRLRSDTMRHDPESVRFRELNPGWVDGDELCCLAPLGLDNLKPTGHRVIASVDPVWD